MSTTGYYIGVDVGTGSVRACLVNKQGKTIASSTQDIQTFRDHTDHRIFEQSTTDIWSCISKVVRNVVQTSGVAPPDIKGIGFDATCSLAVTDEGGQPVVITNGSELGRTGERNIILWADHRAEAEAELINQTGSLVLDYVGGTMSLEMEVPKVLWLKRNMPADLFSRCQFFDLPDYLTYRATAHPARSCCSLTCKCSYVPEKGWQTDFFEKVGLGELEGKGYRQIGEALRSTVLNAGVPVGNGLTKEAADDLWLVEGTPVGSGLIDAYAGWLGTVGAKYKVDGALSKDMPSIEESYHRLAAVAGTSTCHLVQSPNGIFVPGVWGPYKDAVFRGWWMNEGGQSSTGQLIDFILTTHPAYSKLVETAKAKQTDIHTLLKDLLEELRVQQNVDSYQDLTRDLHYYPDFHGKCGCNRSPIADPRMRGSIVGLDLGTSIQDLALKYYAVLTAIALQTRHIISTLNKHGHSITSIYMSGGQARNLTLMQLFADVCDMPVVLPFDHAGAVVLGAAMLGRVAEEASKVGASEMGEKEQQELLWKIMVEMTPPGTRMLPSAAPRVKRLLQVKYDIFLESIDIQKRWRKAIADVQ
ncbi:hypothetical protein PC9H_004792 [Pleurotus ostreatus]|uniref:Pentulose kinase n=1 Tax=Pleurotus ostreatus TaxID=5322 RepID=A0A8H7DTT8_PLEOS|nr:uncharacterized protein PC9H_004792 [Pleurotus ostreatus]KAF7432849.1 hypothetical protein PC9H_004792 [Pleurotus ostreatus]